MKKEIKEKELKLDSSCQLKLYYCHDCHYPKVHNHHIVGKKAVDNHSIKTGHKDIKEIDTTPHVWA